MSKIIKALFWATIFLFCSQALSGERGIGIPCENRVFWNALAKNQDIRSFINKYKTEKINFPEWKKIYYEEFFLNGNRYLGEKMMTERSSLIAPLVFMECLEWEDFYTEYINSVIYEWASQDEWVWPAHNSKNVNSGIYGLDVYSAGVIVDILQAFYLLGDKINNKTKLKVKIEIKKRIVNKLVDVELNKIWWTKSNSNWLFICSLGIVSSVIIVDDDQFNYIKDKFIENIKNVGYPNPSNEGFTYWELGVKSLAIINLLVGEENKKFFHGIDNIIHRAENFIDFSGGRYPAFGDSPLDGYVGWFFKYLWRPDFYSEKNIIYKQILDWSNSGPISFSLAEIFLPIYYNSGEKKIESYFMDYDYGVFGANSRDVRIFLKINQSSGSHAHEDAGSFFVRDGIKYCFGDIGKGVYDKKYFDDKYFNFWRDRLNHPVPVIEKEKNKNNVQLLLDKHTAGDYEEYFFSVTNYVGWLSRDVLISNNKKIKIKDNFFIENKSNNSISFSVPFNPECVKMVKYENNILYKNNTGNFCAFFESNEKYKSSIDVIGEKIYIIRLRADSIANSKIENSITFEVCND